MEWYLEVLRKYAVFSGRSRRREYWTFQLWQFLIVVGLSVVAVAVARATFSANSANLAVLVPALYSLATFLPGLAVQVRRLHDTNHSGWACLIALIPLAGPLILFVWDVQDGTPGDNRFGPSPKLASGSATPVDPGTMGYVAPPLPPDRR